MPVFAEMNLALNFVLFAVSAAFVWLAGVRMVHYADVISEMTGVGHALLGLILLAGVTSLPELAVSLTSAWTGNAPLAVNNILGGVAMQIAFLAIADVIIGKRALTSVVPNPVVILQGSLNVVLLAIAAAGVLVGDVPVLGIGLWCWLILAVGLMGMRQLVRSERRPAWLANPDVGPDTSSRRRDRSGGAAEQADRRRQDLRSVVVKTTAAGATILVAGFLVSRTGDAIAEQTGIGANFAGLVLLAFATSLPEISTVAAAVRLGRYTMAISDIFGTTVFNLLLLFAIDAVDGGNAVMNHVDLFSALGALLCITVTGLYLAGLAERRDRTIWRMGTDSFAVLVVYIAGLMLLYTMR